MRLTPGRLALWGIGFAILGAVLAVIFNNGYDNDNSGAGFIFQALSFVAYAVGILLLIGAGLAKVIQIGVRSNSD